jgi:hypothetical protein
MPHISSITTALTIAVQDFLAMNWHLPELWLAQEASAFNMPDTIDWAFK